MQVGIWLIFDDLIFKNNTLLHSSWFIILLSMYVSSTGPLA